MDGETLTHVLREVDRLKHDLYDPAEGLVARISHIERRVDQILVTGYGVVVALVIGFGSVVVTLLASRP
jgi:hypothetical protein